jgi:hypothetical protein
MTASAADAAANASVRANNPPRRVVPLRRRSTSAIGQSKYHCSSIASDQQCCNGDGSPNVAKYERCVNINRQFSK